MIVHPAIDILGGSAVRLMQGEFGASKVYDERPLDAALRWAGEGARSLHIVDLDGAKDGMPANLEHLRAIALAVDVPIQFGGGLRTLDAVAKALEAGADRAILGTAALTDRPMLAQALERWPEQVVVSVDARGDAAATAGWTQTSDLDVPGAIAQLRDAGVKRFVCTDVDRDGMLSGPDLARARKYARAVGDCALIYSGGIGRLEDLHALAAMGEPRLEGVIVGKALYERRFTLAEAQAALAG